MSDTPRTDKQPLMILFGEMVVPFKFAKQLERELAEAKEKHSALTKFSKDLIEQKGSLLDQLTAHKEALEKCEKALMVTWADLDYLNHWMPTPCRELYMEAKLEIAKLKGSQ